MHYDIQDMVPQSVEWDLSEKAGQELVLTFRPFTVNDEAWLDRHYGKELEKVFSEFKTIEITKIAFNQLELESKRKLMAVKFTDMDEDGNEIEIAKKGPEKIQCLLASWQEQADLIKMLVRTRGLSMPMIEELGQALQEGDKKKA